MSEPFIQFNIRKRFREFELNCKAEFGDGVTALFGPSGAGKTTLLDCITGMLAPDEGHIVVGGHTVFSSETGTYEPPEKRRFGYVHQDPALFPHMSVERNILYGFNLTIEREREIRIDHLVELLGLVPLMGRKVTNLSGGERQRVALARALATSPRMLLLDEPLASLDASYRGTIIAYLKRVVQELGTPMIYVSHSLSEVMAMAEQTLALRKGRRVAFGHSKSVLASPTLSDIAKYADLENILEARVETAGARGTSKITVGNVTLVSPTVDGPSGGMAMVSLRASDIILSLDAPSKISARNIVKARIEEIHEVGSQVLVYLDVGERLVSEITHGALLELGLHPGAEVYMIIKTSSICVMGRL
ncbi:molybdenum ABC transporter ATP-binding protein [Dehalococcoidia bacterium]|nr:molybdenum ABC transporter ATP-binding protein [Dehalococcoidia bacterium]